MTDASDPAFSAFPRVQARDPFQYAPIGVVHTTRAGRALMVNPMLAAILGCATGAEAMALDFAQEVYLSAGEREALMARCEASPDPQAAELQWKRRDGELIWVEVATRAVLDEGGALRFFESFVQDVTARKRAERRLRESEERFRLVERATNDVIWDWDLASGRIRWSESALTIMGYPPSELEHSAEAGRDLVHPADRPRVVARLEAAVRGTADSWSDEYRVRRADGSYATIFNRGYILRDGAGRPVRMVGSAVDVTARRQAEEDLQRVALQLETVREAERKSLARELHDSLGQILTALKLDLAALAQRLPPSSRGARARVRAAGALVDTAMEVTQRVASELRPGILDDLGLAAAVRWAAAEFERRSEIACAVEVEDVGAVDDALGTTIFRVLQESLTNVARHARASQVTIRLAADAGELALTVRDNGRGIDAAQALQGHHLGLRGIRERVSAWGGTADVFGRPDEGTTVRVRVPLRGARSEERAS